MKRGLSGLVALFLSLHLTLTHAEDAQGPVSYVPLTPPLVGNYLSGGRLKLFKADISLRVSSEQAHALVQHHEPLVRHHLVLLFAKQGDETFSQAPNKEAFRQEAFTLVREALLAEDPNAVVDDLLFNNLMTQ